VTKTKLNKIFNDPEEKKILDSIIPGGNKWREWADKQVDKQKEPCIKRCPGYQKECKKNGEGIDLCSDEWGKEEDSFLHLKVLFHVLNNFDYYNRGDLENLDGNSKEIIKLRQHVYDKSLDIAEREIS
jgi:hypothetical protein